MPNWPTLATNPAEEWVQNPDTGLQQPGSQCFPVSSRTFKEKRSQETRTLLTISLQGARSTSHKK